MTTLEELDRLDAQRFRALPRWIAAIIWKRNTNLPPLGHLEHGFDLDDLRTWCDNAMNADPAQANGSMSTDNSSQVGPASGLVFAGLSDERIAQITYRYMDAGFGCPLQYYSNCRRAIEAALMEYCATLNADPAQAISTAQSVESSRVTAGPASGKAPEGE